jgi:hypothetical protein
MFRPVAKLHIKNLYDSAILFFGQHKFFGQKNDFGDVEKMQLAESYIKIFKIRSYSACGRGSSIWIIESENLAMKWLGFKYLNNWKWKS